MFSISDNYRNKFLLNSDNYWFAGSSWFNASHWLLRENCYNSAAWNQSIYDNKMPAIKTTKHQQTVTVVKPASKQCRAITENNWTSTVTDTAVKLTLLLNVPVYSHELAECLSNQGQVPHHVTCQRHQQMFLLINTANKVSISIAHAISLKLASFPRLPLVRSGPVLLFSSW